MSGGGFGMNPPGKDAALAESSPDIPSREATGVGVDSAQAEIDKVGLVLISLFDEDDEDGGLFWPMTVAEATDLVDGMTESIDRARAIDGVEGSG